MLKDWLSASDSENVSLCVYCMIVSNKKTKKKKKCCKNMLCKKRKKYKYV